MAIRMAPKADRLSFFTSSPPRKIPKQAHGMAVIPVTNQTAFSVRHPSVTHDDLIFVIDLRFVNNLQYLQYTSLQ